MDTETVTQPFNTSSEPPPKPTAFERSLARYFGIETTMKIVEKLNQLQIPLPAKGQMISGQVGFMFFSNPHGVMIRIERASAENYGNPVLVNDSEAMLQPLGAQKVDNVSIEIMPGVHHEDRDGESRKLYWKMWADGYHYWDERIDNAGRLPATPEFPDGATVILDRLSASRLTDAVAPVKRALQLLKGAGNSSSYRSPISDPLVQLQDIRAEFRQLVDEITSRPEGAELAKYLFPGKELWHPSSAKPTPDVPLKVVLKEVIEKITAKNIEAKKPAGPETEKHGPPKPSQQEVLHGALQHAFLAAWPLGAESPDAEKMTAFWSHVLEAKQQGKLVAGWSEIDPDLAKTQNKTFFVQQAANRYEEVAKKIGTPYPLVQGLKYYEPPVVVAQGRRPEASGGGLSRVFQKLKDALFP